MRLANMFNKNSRCYQKESKRQKKVIYEDNIWMISKA